MNESTRLNAKVAVPGKTKTKLQRHLTLEMISGWIKLQGFDDYTTQGLIDLASGYPTQALPSFRKNFNLMIERVRQKRKKELQGQIVEKVVEIVSKPLETNITLDLDVSGITDRIKIDVSEIPEFINLVMELPSFVDDKSIFSQELKEEHGEETTAS